MSIKTIVVTGMLLLAGTIVSGQTSTNQVKEKNMEKLELVKEWDKVFLAMMLILNVLEF